MNEQKQRRYEILRIKTHQESDKKDFIRETQLHGWGSPRRSGYLHRRWQDKKEGKTHRREESMSRLLEAGRRQVL